MTEKTEEALAANKSDYVASAAKAALDAVPFAGSLLAEIAGTVIPNQRIERIVSFAKALDARLEKVEQAHIRAQMTNENFTDLVEEGDWTPEQNYLNWTAELEHLRYKRTRSLL